ncbi:MAG: GTPase Era [Helicobacteraceae bacterium]|jgi:GTP-binding protein Era|nr:GTPase Era [Helicobacteraceae bacterium]
MNIEKSLAETTDKSANETSGEAQLRSAPQWRRNANSGKARSGFVAVIGRPNAGKSTLINALVKSKIALVSKKAGATRKRQNAIVTLDDQNAQIIFTDTPGLDDRKEALNNFMQKEALRAIKDSDLVLFLADMADSTQNYEKFLNAAGDKPHLIALTKMDNFPREKRLAKLAEYQKFAEKYIAIAPISAKKNDFAPLLSEIAKLLPEHPFYFDPDDLTDHTIRDIYKEIIREAIFDNFSEEVPYSAEVEITEFRETETLDRVKAIVYVEKESQKSIIIGKGGSGVKRLGCAARRSIEAFSGKKTYLELNINLIQSWRKSETALKKFGYTEGV